MESLRVNKYMTRFVGGKEVPKVEDVDERNIL
jgi:hypothetical protein